MTTDFRPIRGASDLDSLLESWNDLLLTSKGTVFDTPGWILASLESFPPARADVLVTREEGGVTGIAPIAVRRGRRDLTLRTWGELASLPHADYGSVLATERAAPEVADGVIEYFEHRDISALHLGHLSSDLAFTHQLPIAAGFRNCRPFIQPAYLVRRVPIITASLSDRPSLNKRERQLARQGALNFQAFTETRDILEHLEPFFTLHTRRFEERGARSPLRSPSMRRFYAAIVERLAPIEGVVLSMLSLDGKPVAMRFSLRFDGTLYLYAAAFEPTFGRYSPGILQLRRLVGFASDAGLVTLDLGIGDSQHKELFPGGTTTRLVNLEVFRNRLDLAEAKGARWLRSTARRHPRLASTTARIRGFLPARQPE